MRYTALLFVLLLLGTSGLAGSDLYNMENYRKTKSCVDLYQTVKNSDCLDYMGGFFGSFFKGASIRVGFSMAKQSLTIEKEVDGEDLLQAEMDGSYMPAPYYAFSTAKSFFGSSDFGYEFSLSWSNAYALDQTLIDGRYEEDLGTYSTVAMLTINPSVFYAYGARDSTPDIYVSAGIGVGFGYAMTRGTAYITEHVDPASPCGVALANYQEGDQASVDAIKSQCQNITYNESGLGFSNRIFVEGRWKNLYASFDYNNIYLLTETYTYTPQNWVFTAAYVIDIY